MVTSPYEWKILEWDDKPDINKQTNKPNVIFFKFYASLVRTNFNKTYFFLFLRVVGPDKF